MGRTRVATWALSVSISTLVILSVPAVLPVAAAGAGVSLDSGAQTWAYGAYKTVNVTGTSHNMSGSYAYTLRAYFGWQVIFNETNLSATGRLLEVHRTMAENLYATYCQPSCSTPSLTLNLTAKGIESGTEFVNATTAGVVYENGTPVPAVAILNTSASSTASFVETMNGQMTSLSGGRHAFASLALAEQAYLHVDFSPALGLFPTNLSSGPASPAWNSSAAYSAHGEATLGWAFNYTRFNGLAASMSNSSAVFAGSSNGTVGIEGQDLDSLALADGSPVHALTLEIVGPFALRDGLVLLPTGGDLFDGSSASGVASYQSVTPFVQTANVDVRSGPVSHLGLLAAVSTFSLSSDSSTATAPVSVGPLAAGVRPSAESTGTTDVQAQPETVQTAQSWTSCLSAGDCPLPAAAGPGLRGAGILVVAVALVGLAAAVVVVARRRATPPVSHPNAGLYPPGAAGLVSRPPTGPATPPPANDPDPLDHLW